MTNEWNVKLKQLKIKVKQEARDRFHSAKSNFYQKCSLF